MNAGLVYASGRSQLLTNLFEPLHARCTRWPVGTGHSFTVWRWRASAQGRDRRNPQRILARQNERVTKEPWPRFAFLSCRLYGRKTLVNNRCGIAKHFRPKWNRSCAYFIALLRIACLVILYKTCRVPDQELAANGVSGPVWDSPSTT